MQDRVTINVSGHRYETLAATLRRLPQSLLGDDQRRTPFWDATRGEFFFDRSASSFEGVLLAYQTGETRRPAGVSEQTFLEDLRFFGLSKQAELLAGGGGGGTAPPPPPPPTGWAGALVRSSATAAVSGIVTVLSVLVYVVATLPHLQPDPKNPGWINIPWVLLWVELACVLLLFVEVVTRLVTISRLFGSLLNPLDILDLVASLLFFLFVLLVTIKRTTTSLLVTVPGSLARLVRLTRVFRFVKLTSAGRMLTQAAVATAPSFGVILAIWLAAALSFASLFFWLESHVEDTTIQSIPDGLYLAVITMTTAGYGDMRPSTPAGWSVACLCGYTGCVLAVLPAAVLVTKLCQCSAAKESGGQQSEQPAPLCCTIMSSQSTSVPCAPTRPRPDLDRQPAAGRPTGNSSLSLRSRVLPSV